MLRDYYYSIDVYKETDTDTRGNMDTEEGVLVYSHTFQGFLQPRSGGYVQANQANNPLSSHILYCDLSQSFEEGDRIKLNSRYYRLDFMQNDRGIGGVSDHQEISANFL